MTIDNLNEKYYLGGYYIIRPTKRAKYMNENILHEMILSASTCICDFFPDKNVIWCDSKKKKEEYGDKLGLDSYAYEEMEQWINKEFGQSFEFPDVFSRYESAVEFRNKFLYKQKDLIIAGVALPKTFSDAFLEDQEDLRDGICKNINRKLEIDSNCSILGFEILGFEHGGFHSYICNGLENDFYKIYDLKLNRNGFIDTIEEAQKLALYANSELVGTEPVLWLPFAILTISDGE